MARIRTIKPEFFRHEELQKLGPIPMLVFVGLWTQADKAGNFPWRPVQLKLDILPFIQYDIGSTLELLRKTTFIIPYFGPDGKQYGHIPTFGNHQLFFGSEVKAKARFPPYLGIENLPSTTKEVQGSTKEETRISESWSLGDQEKEKRTPKPPVIGSPSGIAIAKVKKEKPVYPENSDAYQLAEAFREMVVDWGRGLKPPDARRLQDWAHTFASMMRLDQRTAAQINSLLLAIDRQKDYLDKDGKPGFLWKHQLLSPETLRQKWNKGRLHQFIKEPRPWAMT